eukprot:CAMPEP_0184093780 /NCGR_PEP_ID=MMETSP0974-20121125/8929_1 /TAXON_ID=483370 /ORGANISM="non described non described, Strain CCMP2097" /LENGTH=126 /DNA_ID=CAMNT_0026396559 /DNA_START=129 /DNA_END=510 /DNA_ORIENTATION=-
MRPTARYTLVPTTLSESSRGRPLRDAVLDVRRTSSARRALQNAPRGVPSAAIREDVAQRRRQRVEARLFLQLLTSRHAAPQNAAPLRVRPKQRPETHTVGAVAAEPLRARGAVGEEAAEDAALRVF